MPDNHVFKDRPFAIRPVKFGHGYSVFWVTGDGPSIEVSDFATEKAAQDWIDNDSKAWLEKRKKQIP
jgi:hypothetical protein